MIRFASSIIFFALLLSGCKETEVDYIFPKDYLPAYPESYWVYSDGTTTKVSPSYHKHKYYEELEGTATTDEVYVPIMNGQYVYEYEITQNNNRIPLKQMLSEVNGDDWRVDYWQDGEIRRKVIDKDVTISLSQPVVTPESTSDGQQTFDSVIIVIEYYKSGDVASPWLTKEYYAPFIGLIRQDVNRDGINIIFKELTRYYISNNR